MSENKHTPGPWTVVECSHGGGLLRRGEQTGVGTHVQSSIQILPLEDARLIAAAPEMLVVLKQFVLDHATSGFYSAGLNATYFDALNVIKRAEGR